MKCELLKRDIGLICKSALRFVDRSVSRIMGCFFGCFRIRDGGRRPHFVSDSTRSKPTEAVVSKNRLSSFFLSEERENSVSNDKKNIYSGYPQINKELVDEAKFLKACGTLPETPSEIRKATGKLKCSPPFGEDSQASDFHSWLPNTSIKKLQLDKQILDQSPTPIKLREKLSNGSVSSEHTPGSCISNVEHTGKIYIISVGDGDAGIVKAATDVQCKNKSVRFECNLDTSSKGSSSENGCNSLGKLFSPGDLSVSKPSPKPTPLKLTDEMQTPGTVFPANVQVIANGKNRIRSQFVYPVLNPVENVSQWKVTQENDFNSHELSSQLGNQTPKPEVGLKGASSVQELKVEASLSSWIKPAQTTYNDDDPNNGTASSKNFRSGRSPSDRPIIGMVAAHWNENEPSQVSPKWWDGNGIPNSTNKYKEDQKVSWHAAPFEERLEKALSEESFISQKKDVSGRPIVFDEHEESDTALSRIHSKSIVLC